MGDLKQMQQEPPDGSSAAPVSEKDLLEWQGSIFGPLASPWEGGVYNVRLTFTEEYPEQPPKVVFISKMFHPNIYEDGKVCLDIIEHKWSPAYTVNTILTSIQSLLTDPNPYSAANPDAAKIYNENRKEYEKLVRQCADRSFTG